MMTYTKRCAQRSTEIRFQKKKKTITVGTVLLYAILSLLVFVCLYPFLNVIAYSLSGYQAVLGRTVSFFPKDFTLDAYRDIVGRRQIWDAMQVTVFVTFMGTLIGLVLTTCAAYALSRNNLPGRGIITGMILFTMYFSGGIIPTFVIVKGLQLRLRSLLFANELNNAGGNAEGVGTQVMTQSLKMACIVVSTLPIIAVYPWLQKYFVKGVMIGSVKG